MKSGLDTMPLFLLDDLLNSFKVNLKFTVPQTHIFLYSYTFTTIQINFNKAPFIIESVKSQNIIDEPNKISSNLFDNTISAKANEGLPLLFSHVNSCSMSRLSSKTILLRLYTCYLYVTSPIESPTFVQISR